MENPFKLPSSPEELLKFASGLPGFGDTLAKLNNTAEAIKVRYADLEDRARKASNDMQAVDPYSAEYIASEKVYLQEGARMDELAFVWGMIRELVPILPELTGYAPVIPPPADEEAPTEVSAS